MSNGIDNYLKIDHFKSRVDGCPRPGSPSVRVVGDEIVAAIKRAPAAAGPMVDSVR